MKLAFMIQAHKNYEQLRKLIDYIISNDGDVYLHIDKKSEDLFELIDNYYRENNKIKILKNRINVTWSGFSQVEATLNLMKEANKKKYDYVSLISGQDLFIKKIETLKKFLEENKGKEFIEYEDIKNKRWRLENYNFFRENKNNRKLIYRIIDNICRRIYPNILKNKSLKNLHYDLYFGSSWFTLTEEAIKYIIDNSTEEFKKLFKYSSCPDEHYFQIILLNSHFKNKCINNNLRYIDWHDCRNSPKTLQKNDLDRITINSNFFARKFDYCTNIEVIKIIYNTILK